MRFAEKVTFFEKYGLNDPIFMPLSERFRGVLYLQRIVM